MFLGSTFHSKSFIIILWYQPVLKYINSFYLLVIDNFYIISLMFQFIHTIVIPTIQIIF